MNARHYGLSQCVSALTAAVLVIGLGGTVITSASAATKKSPIIIGGALARSGFMTSWDIPDRYGATLAINAINKQGGLLGHPLKLETLDSASSVSQEAEVATQLLDRGAKVILTSCDFNYGGPAAEDAELAHVIAFECAGDPRSGSIGFGPYVFDVSPMTTQEGATIADYAYQVKHWKTAFVFEDTAISYFTTDNTYFQKVYKKIGGKVLGTQTFLNSDASISAQIAAYQALPVKPAFIFLDSAPPGGATALHEIRAAGITVPIYSGYGFDGSYWLSGVPDLTNWYHDGVVDVFGSDPESSVNALRKQYIALAGQNPSNAQVFTGYASIQLYAAAVRKADTFNAAKVKNVIRNSKDVATVLGPTSIDPATNGTVTPMRIEEVVNGKQTYLQEYVAKNIPKPSF